MQSMQANTVGTYAGRTDAISIDKKTNLMKRFQYLSQLLLRFHDMGSTEAQLMQGTYYSFGVDTLLDEVMRIGVDYLGGDQLVIGIFAEFNNFLAALICRNPMLQNKVWLTCFLLCRGCCISKKGSGILCCNYCLHVYSVTILFCNLRMPIIVSI